MNKPEIVSVIDIGSTAVRLVVAEIRGKSGWRILDRAGKPVPLGRDVFSTGNVSRDSLNQTLRILQGFSEILSAWKIEEKNVTVIATSALREARNRDTFIDRVHIKTGLQVSVVEGIEENRLTYNAVQYAVEELRPQLGRSNSLIIEVGGGSTEVMLLQRGKIVAAHSLNIGTVRIEQFIENAPGADYRARVLGERISTMTEVLDTELEMKRIKYFIAVGGHARLAALKAGGKERELYSIIEKTDFVNFIKQILYLRIDECVNLLQIPYDDAEGMVTALLIYKHFLDQTSADHLIVPGTSIREGILLNIALGLDPQLQEKFHFQVIASALSLGRKFHFDEEHAAHVAELALKLFDEFQTDHGLDEHAKLLLEVAGLLHDVGSYIRFSGHHKHSQYIVSNSEIFGLHRDDIQIISNVVRYHRKSLPTPAHTEFISLSRENRIQVLKLSAMLRVADALDRGHNQRIKDFTIERREEQIVLQCSCMGDISSEKISLATKAEMFEEVFGLRVILA